MSIIYAGIAEAINKLDATTPSPSMTLINNKRAYMSNDDTPYRDFVHFSPISECWILHRSLQKTFLNRAEYQGRVYAGTAGEVNLTYIAASKAPVAILYDINPLQKLFWDLVIENLANHDDADNFITSMDAVPYRLSKTLMQDFNMAADTRYGRLSFENPFEGNDASTAKQKTSPLLNMRYGDFRNWFEIHAGYKDTGYIFCGDKDLAWLQNPDQYAHIHSMAKHGAIAALTLDITDRACTDELQHTLDTIAYTPLTTGREGLSAKPQKRLRIETLYTSNIGYYLQWSAKEIAAQKKEYGTGPTDFCGRSITTDTWRNTVKNLRKLTNKDTLILNFDQAKEGMLGRPDFYPAFKISSPETTRIPKALDPDGLTADIV